MKKRIFASLLALFFCISFVGCGNNSSATTESSGTTSGSTSDDKIIVKYAHEEAPGSYQDLYANKFAEIISEKTSGQVEVQVYTIGQIGSDQDLVQLVQTGGVQMSNSTPSISSTVIPEAQVFDLQFIFSNDIDVNAEVLKTSKALNEDLTGIYAEKGIKVLGYWTQGYNVWTANKPLEKIDDFKGFKMRTMQSPLLMASYKSYGANPSPMPFSEVYSGLQLSTIDGQENPMFYVNQNNLFEVQNYITDSRHSLYVTATCINPKFYDSLTDDLKVAFEEAVVETNEYSVTMQQELNDNAAEEMLSKKPNLAILTLTDDARAKFIEAAATVRQEYIDSAGAKGETILNKLLEEIAAAEGR